MGVQLVLVVRQFNRLKDNADKNFFTIQSQLIYKQNGTESVPFLSVHPPKRARLAPLTALPG